jgi:hypothetical protein
LVRARHRIPLFRDTSSNKCPFSTRRSMHTRSKIKSLFSSDYTSHETSTRFSLFFLVASSRGIRLTLKWRKEDACNVHCKLALRISFMRHAKIVTRHARIVTLRPESNKSIPIVLEFDRFECVSSLPLPPSGWQLRPRHERVSQ